MKGIQSLSCIQLRGKRADIALGDLFFNMKSYLSEAEVQLITQNLRFVFGILAVFVLCI